MPARVAADELLIHAVGEHDAPLIVVAAQHQFADVGELIVLVNHARGEVAVVIVDGHALGVVMIQLFGDIVGEQEILVHKLFHWFISPLYM